MIAKLSDIVYEGIIYKPMNHNEVRCYYKAWLSDLTYAEKRTFQKYRHRQFTKNNVNEKLRQHKECNDSVTMSVALQKSKAPCNMLVFRSLDKKENNYISNLSINDEYINFDFKGTHVYDRIPNNYRNSSGYILYLIPKGYNAAYINNVTLYATKEREFLIDMNSKCKLIDKCEIKQKPCYIVKMQTD